MQRRRAPVWRWSLWLLAWLLLALGSGPWASEAREPVLALDIRAQDLASALDAFSSATGMAVLVDHELTQGRRSVRVKGDYSAREGLSTLLTGSGLMARYARVDAFTLQEAQVRTASRPAGKAGARLSGSYARALQLAIERSLCATALTRPGTYRAALQVWIGGSGRIEHSRLLGSTGNAQRDEALVLGLRQVQIERLAPSSLRQPLTLLLLPDPANETTACPSGPGAAQR